MSLDYKRMYEMMYEAYNKKEDEIKELQVLLRLAEEGEANASDYPGRRNNYYWDPASREEMEQEIQRKFLQVGTLQELLQKADLEIAELKAELEERNKDHYQEYVDSVNNQIAKNKRNPLWDPQTIKEEKDKNASPHVINKLSSLEDSIRHIKEMESEEEDGYFGPQESGIKYPTDEDTGYKLKNATMDLLIDGSREHSVFNTGWADGFYWAIKWIKDNND